MISTFTLVEQVQAQFLGVFFLLFPPHFSSQRSPQQNKRLRRASTNIAPQVARASAKTIDRRRNLSPVKGTNLYQRESTRPKT